ncbi:membrane protein [Burkholderiaceae bacterium 16]|nr:membrane protein [Burkholderiaceae bacterium 16]
MRKALLPLAMLGAVGTAQAQTAVTVYGVVDSNVEFATNIKNASGGSDSRFALNGGGLSGSRWGFRGTEDLGGGLSGLFVLESGIGVDTGTLQQGGRLFGRQAYVGLKSAKYGQITFGRQYTSLDEALANFSPAYYANTYEPVIAVVGPAFREDNTVKYMGTFGAITVGAHWSFGTGANFGTVGGAAIGGAGEAPGQFRRDSGYGAQVSYFGEALSATIAYDQVNPGVVSGAAFLGTGTVRKAAAALGYAIGPAKIEAGYRWGRSTGPQQTLVRDDIYWAGVAYQVTSALGLTLDYFYQDFHSSTLPALRPPGNPWQLMFIADYNFSKRTDVYLTTAYAKNAGLALDTASIGFSNGYPLAPTKTNMLGVALGIRHKF